MRRYFRHLLIVFKWLVHLFGHKAWLDVHLIFYCLKIWHKWTVRLLLQISLLESKLARHHHILRVCLLEILVKGHSKLVILLRGLWHWFKWFLLLLCLELWYRSHRESIFIKCRIVVIDALKVSTKMITRFRNLSWHAKWHALVLV